LINLSISAVLRAARPVLPVLTLEAERYAVPLASALFSGGLRVIEVTLRTPAALAAITRLRAEVPSLIIGAGSVVAPHQLRAAQDAGAQFAVSPGLSPLLIRAAARLKMPYLPGVMTPSEMMAALELGCATVKLFPAALAGGAALLKAVGGPIAGLRFCPTGGIDADSCGAYLALDNVICVGGSWFLADELVREDWAGIERAAQKLSTAYASIDRDK
jgi:2-dehydro-3-deoxyphosphogluconate aldolase / (4S)-4-hydroxy-2-oxoglutarate aldolase